MEQENRSRTYKRRTNITINCSGCGKSFERIEYEFERKSAQGQTKFFCTESCAKKSIGLARINEFSPFKIIFAASKSGAKKKKLEFNLTLIELKKKWDEQKGICPYSKKKMVLPTSASKKTVIPSLKSASLDRIDSSKGYTLDNIEFVTRFVNLGKNTYPGEDVHSFLKEMIEEWNRNKIDSLPNI